MLLTRVEWKKKFSKAASALKENAEMLSKLDAQTGDGDHGVTIARMAQIMEDAVENWQAGTSVKDFLDNLGWHLMNANGGSAGPLWGTMVGGMAEGAGDGDTDAKALKQIFQCALVAMGDITSARLGEKTMMDALIPACAAAEACQGSPKDIFIAAAKAAEEGAEKTKAYIARFGRAKNLKEKAIGHKDPGAVSLAILLKNLA